MLYLDPDPDLMNPDPQQSPQLFSFSSLSAGVPVRPGCGVPRPPQVQREVPVLKRLFYQTLDRSSSMFPLSDQIRDMIAPYISQPNKKKVGTDPAPDPSPFS